MAQGRFLADVPALDMYCLRVAYPAITGRQKDSDGKEWLTLANGKRLLYVTRKNEGLATDIKEAMAQPYPLEPERPPTPSGFAPGRKRAYDMLNALYGADATRIARNLHYVSFLNRKLAMAPQAAAAFEKVKADLAHLAQNVAMRSWLIPEGAFHWRKIAGENVLSSHSYGIAVDIGVKKSPYWRWSKVMPHPLQKTYPSDIVSAFERHGFIWGGKWHEYDLMHYEYRPELVCKARMLRALQKRQ